MSVQHTDPASVTAVVYDLDAPRPQSARDAFIASLVRDGYETEN